MPKEAPELLQSTGYLVARVGAESRRRFVEVLSSQDLTLAEFGILMLLGGTSGTAQRQLAIGVGIDPRNLVPILDELESHGLVVRDSHPSDRRRHVVKLSSKGRAQLTRLRTVGAQAEESLLKPLSARERNQLRRLLTRLL